VGILGDNSLFWTAAYLASMKLGAITVPFPTVFTPEDFTRNINFMDCKVICALKANRRIDKKCIDQYDQTLKHNRYQRVKLDAADSTRKARTYQVRIVRGHLEDDAG